MVDSGCNFMLPIKWSAWAGMFVHFINGANVAGNRVVVKIHETNEYIDLPMAWVLPSEPWSKERQ